MKYVWHYIKGLYAFSGPALYVNIAGLAAGSLLESVGLLMLVPLLGLIGIVSVGTGDGWLGRAAEWLDGYEPLQALLLVLGVYIAASFGQQMLQRLVMIRNAEFQQRFANHLRLEVYRLLLGAGWPFYLRKRGSDLVNLMTTELARVIGAVNLVTQLASSLIFTIVQIAVALLLSPSLTVFVLVCGAGLGILSRRFIRKARELGSQTSEHARHYMSGIADGFNGMKDIKSNTLEPTRLAWLEGLTERMAQEQLSYVRLRMNSQLVYKGSSALLIAAFILACFALFQTQGAQLLAITAIFARLWPQFTSIQSNMQQLYAMIPACKAVYELQEESRKAAERPASTPNGGAHAGAPLPIGRGIACRGVSFRYDKGAEEATLDRIDLFIPANRMTAIAGASGSGKSTLIDLIMGLIKPDEGRILVDGEDIGEERLLAYRQSISYVPQDPFLFNATIRDNISMLRKDATEEEIWEALEFASCAEFVRSLPDGLDTVIGDRGVRLSGGERQRLVLARAIIRRPSVLVLDEATSALDAGNEARIQEAIDRLKGTMTVIVVAHRLTTIRNADQVIVMNRGRVAEQGDYATLASDAASLFGRLLNSQFKEASA